MGEQSCVKKDPVDGNALVNYWLIRWLLLMWKLLAGMIADERCNYIEKVVNT